MSSSPGPSRPAADTKPPPPGTPRRPIQRGIYRSNLLGTAAFCGSRLADPFLQYHILQHGWGSALVERLGGSTLAKGPPVVTHTLLDRVVGLSQYRSILLGMSALAALKQTLHHALVQREEMPPGFSLGIGAANAALNSANDVLFIAAQTSASVNGDFPQTPLVLGASLFGVGLAVEAVSEVQRHVFKRDPANRGKLYDRGLFALSRHVNYFGYMLWRTGYAMAGGGFVWAAATAGMLAYAFVKNSIPELQDYLQDKVSRHWHRVVLFARTDSTLVRLAV